MSNEAGKGGSAASLALGIAFGAVLVMRVLWSGVTYPESNAAVLFLLALLLAGYLCISAVTGETPRLISRTDGFVLLYFMVVLLLSICSARRWLARDFLFQTAACTAAYLLAEKLGSSRPARIAIAAGLAAGVILVSLYGLYQYLYGLNATRAFLRSGMKAADQGSAFASRVSSDAIFSTFFYPNALAGYLIIAIPFLASIPLWPMADALPTCYGIYLGVLLGASVGWGLFNDLWGRPFLLVCLFAAAGALLSGLTVAERKRSRIILSLCAAPLVILPLWVLSRTSSEGAWLAMFLSVLFTPLLMRRRYRLAAVIGIVLLSGALLAVLADAIPSGASDSAGARVDYWRAAARIWRENPVRGIGPGGFAGAYARFRTPGSEEGRLPHSIYLGLGSEMGVIGLAAFVCLWISCIGALIKSQIPNPKSQICHSAGKSQSYCSSDRGWGANPLAFAVMISICAFLLHGAIDVDLSVPETSLTIWVLAGLGVGVSAGGARRMPALPCALMGSIVLVAALFWIGPHARAEWHRVRSQGFEMKGMSGRARDEILNALKIEGDNPVYWNSLAEIADRAGRGEDAIACYRRAAEYGEGIAAYHFRLAAAYWRSSFEGSDKGRAASAIDELRKAIACSPHDVDYHLLLAFWLEKTGRPAGALEEYRRGLTLIGAALEKPKRIRRHDPAEYERLDSMVRDRVAELERAGAGRG